MTQYDKDKDPTLFLRRGVTLNSLKEQQFSLNMRMLLAVQNHDQAMQEELKGQLAQMKKEIEALCMGGRMDR